MSNEELLQKLHHTWVKALIHDSWNEYAAILVDAQLSFKLDWDNNVGDYVDGLLVYLPYNVYSILSKNDRMQDIIKHYFLTIAKGHIPNWENSDDFIEKFPIDFRVKLLDVEEDWQKIIKFLITKSKDLNQGRVSEIVFSRDGKETLIYNEMKFASQSEIRIAQELERRCILFFPLPLAVRCESGKFYKDHREVDFLVCLDGTFGILEVSYHEGRYEKDKEKDAWFKKSGILCVESYLSEKCYNHPAIVVNEFLSILEKHKR